MDWMSIGIIVLAVILLIVFQGLTGAESRTGGCQAPRPNVAKGGDLKNETIWKEPSKSEEPDETK